jgi:hypothetical protein
VAIPILWVQIFFRPGGVGLDRGPVRSGPGKPFPKLGVRRAFSEPACLGRHPHPLVPEAPRAIEMVPRLAGATPHMCGLCFVMADGIACGARSIDARIALFLQRDDLRSHAHR